MTAPAIALPGRALSVIVHADTKVGKSTFGNTTRAPRLLLDAEMAYRFLPGKKVFWDPMVEAPPVPGFDCKGNPHEWETCVVIVRTYNILTRAYDWLNSGQHHFISMTIDSISEIQSRCKDQLTADGRMSRDLWGDLLTHMEKLVRGFRDLSEHPTRPLEAVVLTAMTQMKDGKYRPYVQGQLQVKMPYFLDVIGFLFVQEIQQADPTLPPVKMRRLLVSPSGQFEAGERVQGRLGDVVDEPTVTKMLDMVFGALPS